MKTLGQMLMDAHAKADTVETVALIGDRLKFTHKANANEQVEAAFSEELCAFVVERMNEPGFDERMKEMITLCSETSTSWIQFQRCAAARSVRMILGIQQQPNQQENKPT